MQKIELDILRFFRSNSNKFFDVLAECITALGEQMVIVIILAFFYFIYNKRVGKKIAYTIFTSISLNGSIKGIVCRPRPFTVDPTLGSLRVETATGFSFPSGHTQNAATTYLSTAKHFNKKYIWIIAITITLLIGFSRIFLGVHYPTDVIVGLILGLLCALFLSFIYEKYAHSFKTELFVYVFSLIPFIPFIFIFFRSNYKDIEIYEDFYKIFSMYLGFIGAFIIDEKFIQFDTNTSLLTKLLRLLGAGICYIIVFIGLKLLLPSENIFFIMLRYFCITFVVLGIYPLIFKNILFKKYNN